MNPVERLKQSIQTKNCVKIIAGIDNYDIENISKVITAANKSGADAVDVAAREDIIKFARENTDLAIFVSSTEPQELLMAAQNGADALEIGNFDAYYKKGQRISAQEVLEVTEKTLELVGEEIMLCVTIPGHIDVAEQVQLAQKLEEMGIDLIQTEGAATIAPKYSGARGLMEKAIVSVSNTVELCKNVEIPVMTASGISPTTAPMAFAAGASAVGVGSCVNKLSTEIEMIAAAMAIVEAVKVKSEQESPIK